MVDETMENPIGHGLRSRTFVPSAKSFYILKSLKNTLKERDDYFKIMFRD
jgi:hypothetical protein